MVMMKKTLDLFYETEKYLINFSKLNHCKVLNIFYRFVGRIVLLSGRQWMLMIEGTESKDYSILAPVMGQIEESETIFKLKKIENVNFEQERI